MPIANGCYYTISPLGKAGDLPLILIHGAGGSSLGWHTRIRRMPGRTIYALDLPGHGKSPGEGRHHIDGYARDVIGFIESVGIYQAVLGGHSLGGMIAMQTALLKPDRIAGLVLVSTSADCPIPEEVVQGLLHPVTYKLSLDWLVERLAGNTGERRWVDATRQAVEQTRRGVLYGDLVACRSADLSGRLPEIQIPTTICGGEQDRFFTPQSCRKLARTIPNAALHCIAGAGHLLPLEKPDELSELIIQFMEGLLR